MAQNSGEELKDFLILLNTTRMKIFTFFFVENFLIILARTLGISPINNDEYIKKISKEMKTKKFILEIKTE